MAYIKTYSKLSPPEIRQLNFKERYKNINPHWDDSLIILCKWFGKFIKPGMRVLDVGCGQGNMIIDEYRDKISRAIGVDRNRQGVSKNICLDKIVIADAEKLPFEDESFDVVLSLWVLEHLKDPKKAAEEIHRVLKKGGVFIFVTPNKSSYLLLGKRVFGDAVTRFILKVFFGRREGVFKTYYKANSLEKISSLLEDAGFKEEKLILNSDPSYLSLNEILFRLGVLMERLNKFDIFNLTKIHILGAYTK